MDPKAKELFKNASQKNNVSRVKKILEENRYLVDQRDVEYRTVLHRACQNHDLELINYLVQNHHKLIDAKDTGGWTCFHFFIDGFKSNVQKIPREVYNFVQSQCTVEVKHRGRGKATAGSHHNANEVFGSQVQAADNQGMTPLMHMCRIFKKAEGASEEEGEPQQEDDESGSDDSDDEGDEAKANTKMYRHEDILELLVANYKKKIFDHNVLGETAIAIAQRRGEAALLALMKFVVKHELDSEMSEIRRLSLPRAKQEEKKEGEQWVKRGQCGCSIS
mmetsp:Transcript_24291/g.33963  ORF Transcript_24291/g.33963 Transcript_24291/m.33963 type:complete len:277 (+) Transcript_24291:90-920(+)